MVSSPGFKSSCQVTWAARLHMRQSRYVTAAMSQPLCHSRISTWNNKHNWPVFYPGSAQACSGLELPMLLANLDMWWVTTLWLFQVSMPLWSWRMVWLTVMKKWPRVWKNWWERRSAPLLFLSLLWYVIESNMDSFDVHLFWAHHWVQSSVMLNFH